MINLMEIYWEIIGEIIFYKTQKKPMKIIFIGFSTIFYFFCPKITNSNIP